MAAGLIHVSPLEARVAIARAVLGRRPDNVRVGSITLRPHQVDALRQCEAMISRHRGALLADDVGLGKTYVALAAARGRRAVIVCPASLREMWHGALSACAMRAPVVTHESLGRRQPALEEPPEMIVVDEAHHARNPRTARYRRLARLCAGVPVLLLSATPVHNHHRELCAILALFLGTRAHAMSEAELLECVVRRTHRRIRDGSLPRVLAPRTLMPPDDDLDPAELLKLPPPVPPRDGGDAGSLIALGLVHRWTSSRAALTASLRKRLAGAIALESTLADGRLPDGRDLARWIQAPDVVQLGFGEIIGGPPTADAERLLEVVRAHADAVRRLLRLLEQTPDVDAARAGLIRDLRRDHPRERIVAFSQYAETVAMYWRRLSGEARVALLTAGGAGVAGGALSRREALERFAPKAHDAPEPRRAERIDLLLTTDLLSEGVNLQDASIVVHLDTAWTPARMEQRVGRIARMGSEHDRVWVYRMAPPAEAERVLAIERRLAEKVRQAGRTVGLAGAIVPSMAIREPRDFDEIPPAEHADVAYSLLDCWMFDADHAGPHTPRGGAARVACLQGDMDAWIALLRRPDGSPRIVTGIMGEISEHPLALVRGCGAVDRAERMHGNHPASPELARREIERLERWLDEEAGESCVDLALAAERRERRAVLQRIAFIAARTPFHRRAALAPLSNEARHVATARLGVGLQRELVALARAEMEDEAWLRAVVSLAERATKDPSGGRAQLETFLLVVGSIPLD